MKFRVFYIKKSGLISWYDVVTINECVAVAKQEKQSVDVYEYDKQLAEYVYLMSVEVL